MKSELRRVDSDYDADNPLLFVALGMVSALASLERLCDEHAPTTADPNPSASSAADDAALFVLGLIAFKRRLERALATQDSATSPANPAPVVESRSSLLR